MVQLIRLSAISSKLPESSKERSIAVGPGRIEESAADSGLFGLGQQRESEKKGIVDAIRAPKFARIWGLGF